jgi:mannitol/fructose-specific phosphotransferase system IIA component
MHDYWFGHKIANPHSTVERTARILKDHLHVPAMSTQLGVSQ